MYSLIPFQRREGNIFRYLDDIERSFFNNSIAGREQFRTDISEKDGAYLLQAELPGFDREDISVSVDGDMLTISASHKEENDETDDNGNFIRRERRFGSFSRSFNAEGIDVDGIKASYKNGVLNLELPKLAEQPQQARTIEIMGEDAPKAVEAGQAKESKKPKLTAKARKTILPKNGDAKGVSPNA